jgi:hypothetical protein
MAQARDEAGNIWEVDAQGNPVRLIQAVGQQAPQPTVTPLDLPPPASPQAPGRTPAGAATEGAPKGFAWVDPNNPSAGFYPIGGLPPEAREGSKPQEQLDRGKVGQFLALEKQLAEVKRLYRAGPGSTQGASSVLDYLPGDANAAFDSAGAGLSEVGLAAFRVPGVGGQSDAELRQFVAANTPRAGDRDTAIEQKLRNLETRLQSVKQAWGVDPNAPAEQLLKQFGDDPNANTNALDQIRTANEVLSPEAVPLADSQSTQYRDVDDPVLRRAHDDLVQRLLSEGGGRLDPQAYAEGVAALNNEFGYKDPTGAQGRIEWANSVNNYLDSGGRTVNTTLTAREQMSAAEIAANNLVNNPFVAAPIGFANGITGGIPEAFAPGEFAALRDSQGIPLLAGEIGGAVVGVKGLGAIGRNTIGRASPSLLGGGTTGRFARNVAADATYGGFYGQNTQGDPLTGALLGTVGSVGGQGVAKGLGASVGGLQRTAAAQALRQKGVPISVARQLGLGRVEDLSQSIPLVGDVSRARQADSFVGFNQAAFQEGADPALRLTTPVQAQSGAYARDGINALKGVERQAYGNTLDPVTVGIDPQFTTDFAALARQIDSLPPDYQAAARTVVQNRVAPAVAGGQMTGREYQQAIRGIRAARAKANSVGNTGFEDRYIGALNSAEDALTGAIQRGGGAHVTQDLKLANEVYSNRKILENASLDRARVGTRSGEVNVFTPSQLLDATRHAEVRYGTGASLRELGEQGQQVLPTSVPNSGTADRTLFSAGILGGAGLLGTGSGYANDQSLGGAVEGAGTGIGTAVGIGSILAALGTRRGQQVLEQILISRPQAAQAAGQGFRRRAGIFGSAGAVSAQQ